MHDVIGINFETGNRVYYFSTNNLDLKKNDKLVVETERGLQFCVAVTDIIQIPDSKIVTPLRPILRIANKEDIIALLTDKNVPGDEITYNDLADEIFNNPPEQGYLTISNALQWRL